MTIEEKAKAYDEALEQAKFYHGNCPNEPERKKLEKMFPELRESEDEMHRKWILEYLYDGLRKADEQFKDHFKSAIDWLERKKIPSVSLNPALGFDPGSAVVYHNDESENERIIEEIKFAVMQMPSERQDTKDRCLAWLEKQKESLHVQETCKENADSFTSEDERIRKEIIDFLETIPASELKRIPRPISEWFSYLEKQKEQKPVDYDHEMWKNCEANFEGGKKEVIEHPEKYGLHKEQKPTISDEAIREGIVHFGITQYQIDNWLKKHINIVEQKEQKPADKEQDSIAFLEQYGYTIVPPHAPVSIVPSSEAMVTEWSEEDEKMQQAVINCIDQLHECNDWQYVHVKNGNTTKNIPIGEVRKWVESLNLSKQEWSEEDETIIEGACNALEIHGHTKLASMLKSLRPSWKPSEEQMNCLCAAVDAAIRKHNESVSGYKPARILKSLYEDLQKLM